jgi:hypothetical protein
MRFKNFFPEFKRDGEVIAIFGEARLIKTVDFKYELRGGSEGDHAEAQEWISLFMHDVVIRNFSPRPPQAQPQPA